MTIRVLDYRGDLMVSALFGVGLCIFNVICWLAYVGWVPYRIL